MMRRSGTVRLLALLLLCAATEAVADEAIAARRERIERMSAEEKHSLLKQRQRFDGLDDGEQDRLRRLHQDIERDPQQDELLRVMKQYHQWLAKLPLSERAKLAALEPDQRIKRIGELLDKQKRQGRARPGSRGGPPWGGAGMRPPESFTPEDINHIRKWIGEIARRHQEQFMAELPAETRARLQKDLQRIDDSRQRDEVLTWYIWLRWLLDGAKTARIAERITDKDMARIGENLSPAAKAFITKLPADRRKQRVGELIRGLVLSHFASRRFLPPPSVIHSDELKEFWENGLSPQQRERMQNMPVEDMRRMLWFSYLRSKFQNGPGPSGDRGGRMRRPGEQGSGMQRGRDPRGSFSPPGSPPRPQRPPDGERSGRNDRHR